MGAAQDQETSVQLKLRAALKDVPPALGQAKSCVQAVFAQGRKLRMSMILGLIPSSRLICGIAMKTTETVMDSSLLFVAR